MTPLVVLVGPPGAGKTTVGRLVAQRRGVSFLDSDTLVEERAGKPVADIFVEDGEAAFRALEQVAVADALTGHPGVLALGGGAVLDPGSRALLAGHRVVLLDVGPADAAERVGLNRDRPLLLGNPRARLRELLAQRRPLYAQVATATVDTGGRTAEQVADAVEEVLP